MHQKTLSIHTSGRGTTDISAQVAAAVAEAGVSAGLCCVFVQHTSASLMLCENADPQVRADMEAFMSRVAPDGDPLFKHVDEGPDDMPAHVRTVLTDASLTIPVANGAPMLGVWQGVYLWEHRHRAHTRHIVVTVSGD